MKSLLTLVAVLTFSSFSVRAECVAKQHMTSIQTNNEYGIESNVRGFYQAFKDELEKKGYEVCFDSQCTNKNINLELHSAMVSVLKTKKQGPDIGDYVTYLVLNIDGNSHPFEFITDDHEQIEKEAKKRLRLLVKKCKSK